MFRLAIFTAMFLSGAIATTVANAQTTPENAKQSSDDSDLFALPKTPKRDIKANIAAAKKEADAARTSRIAAEKRADAAEKSADAAEKRADAAEKAVESLRELGKPKSDDSDLFALPKENLPSFEELAETVAAEAKQAEIDRITAEKRADAAEKSADAAEKSADAAEKRADAAQEAAGILTKLANPQDNDSDLFALPKTPRRDIKADIAAAKKEADAVKKEAEAAKAIADLTEDLSND